MSSDSLYPHHPIFDILRNPDLTSFLKNWSGEKIFKRALNYYQQEKVKDIVITRDERLLATVKGSRNYVSSLYLDNEKKLAGRCNCPYDGTCKHVVALALQANAALLQQKNIPVCNELDFRRPKLDDSCTIMPSVSSEALKEALSQLSREKLLDLLLRACEKDEDIAIMCVVCAEPDKIGIQALTNNACNAIVKAASPDFENDIEPDYSQIAQKLSVITAAGKAAETLSLAKAVFDSCTDTINYYDHDGELIGGVYEVATVSLIALQAVDWPQGKKLLWIIRAMLQDEFGYTEPLETYFKEITDASIWAEVSQFLEELSAQKLESINKSRLSRLLKLSLDKAGMKEAVLQIYEKEAQENGDYLRLVNYLIAHGNDATAEKWIKKGMKASKFSYQIQNLRERLIEIRERAGDQNAVIILETENFVESPGVSSYEVCARTAQKSGQWKALQPLLMQYLISGKLPWLEDTWPCRQKGSVDSGKRTFPLYYELIEVAIYEKRPMDALKWHDQQRASGDSRKFPETYLAEAIKDVAPKRALAIWQSEAERLIDQTNSKSYFEAEEYIKKILTLAEKGGNIKPWLLSLRERHKRKKNFIKILDDVEKSFLFCSMGNKQGKID